MPRHAGSRRGVAVSPAVSSPGDQTPATTSRPTCAPRPDRRSTRIDAGRRRRRARVGPRHDRSRRAKLARPRRHVRRRRGARRSSPKHCRSPRSLRPRPISRDRSAWQPYRVRNRRIAEARRARATPSVAHVHDSEPSQRPRAMLVLRRSVSRSRRTRTPIRAHQAIANFRSRNPQRRCCSATRSLALADIERRRTGTDSAARLGRKRSRSADRTTARPSRRGFRARRSRRRALGPRPSALGERRSLGARRLRTVIRGTPNSRRSILGDALARAAARASPGRSSSRSRVAGSHSARRIRARSRPAVARSLRKVLTGK